MKLAALHALIAAGESQTMEFKTSFDKASIDSLAAYEARGYTTDQLSVTKIQRFLRLVNQHGRFAVDESDPHAALHKLHYLKNGQPTWAALLLFADEPIRHNVHIGRFKTPDMIIDDRQFTDTCADVADLVEQFHYQPATTVKEGIQCFVDWYRNEFKLI